MKGRVIFLVEELSMYRALQAIMPKLFPTWEEKVHWLAIPHHGKEELGKLVPGYRKTAGSSTIAKHLDLASNRSQSLRSFVTGLRTLVETMAR